MGILRKQALKQIAGKSLQVEAHLAKIMAETDPGLRRHWRSEAENLIDQVLAAARAIGDRTSDEVRQRVAGWRSQLEQSDVGTD